MKRLLPALLFSIFLSHAFAKDPPMYPYPASADITVDDIVPTAMDNLKNPGYVPGMKSGEKVLIVTDRSVDPLTKEAFYVAAWRLGASQVDTIELQGRLDVTDPADIILQIFETNWWPQWVWAAAADYDRLIPLAYFNAFNLMQADTVPGKGWVNKWAHETNTVIHMLLATHQQRERLLASKDYPNELVSALIRKGYKTMRKGKRFHLTDPNGTDLSWTLDEAAWQGYQDLWGDIVTNHSARLHMCESPDMHGVFISDHLPAGRIPRIEMQIDKGRVIEVKGGGKMGEWMREYYDKYQHVQYPYFPGPGVDWVEYAVWGFYPVPDFTPLPESADMAWSGKMWANNIDLKAGIVHLAMGTAVSGFTAEFTKQNAYPFHHKDFVLFRPTLTVDGEVIIDAGHLTALDDPEIRAVAAKYGDPDKLLKQHWSADEDPRFAP